jgi:hypothetical protein
MGIKMSKERTSFNYNIVDEPITLTVHTRCPQKWILVDRETGQTYQGNIKGHWDRLDPVVRNV